MAAAVKDNKNVYINTLVTKGGLRIIFILLDAGKNIVTQEEEKTEVLNGFFALVFYNQNSCS